MSRSLALAVEKAFSLGFYQQQWMNFKVATYNYYHPKFRAGRCVRSFVSAFVGRFCVHLFGHLVGRTVVR